MSIEKFGRYLVKSELNRGGMATIYHAYDPVFERDVAIKVLPSILLQDPSFRTRFDREAKTIASLEHPSIVPVYDFGEQDEQPFIVMRYMAGGSLSDRLKQGTLSLEETSKIITRLAPALDAAHSRGVIHRDIKPGNILFDQYGNAFLTDFGIAHITQQGSGTMTGDTILGTPTYMSPEQVHGEKSIDGRSDIYSLGVLIFQMLTGQSPYHAETPTKLMMMHVLEPVPSLINLAPDLAPFCEQIVSKALAKNPDERYTTAGELATNLELANQELHTFLTSSGQSMESAKRTRVLNHNMMIGDLVQDSESATRVQTKSEKQATKSFSSSDRQVIEESVQKKALSPFMYVMLCVGLICLMITSGLMWVLRSGTHPFAIIFPQHTAPVPTLTNTISQAPILTKPVINPPPTITQASPTTTSSPTISVIVEPSPTIPDMTRVSVPVIGGADKISFLSENDIWIANLDGTELKRLTDDGTIKSNLQWSHDGKAINYIYGKCVQTINIESGKIDTIICFNFIDYLKAFEISPDGNKVAISLDNQLYIVPYDLERFSSVKIRSDLTKMADCTDLAPYLKNYVKTVRWSADGTTLAAVVIGVGNLGLRSDIIRVFDVSQCTPDPQVLDHFPSSSRFLIKDFEKNSEIQNFTWDGINLFALTSALRNGGFGDLYIYNMELHKGRLAINPVQNSCCYRDPQWSPDGNYLFFVYQDIRQGLNATTQFYYIHYATIGTGIQYKPLPLPVLTALRANPQPALRPALP